MAVARRGIKMQLRKVGLYQRVIVYTKKSVFGVKNPYCCDKRMYKLYTQPYKGSQHEGFICRKCRATIIFNGEGLVASG